VIPLRFDETITGNFLDICEITRIKRLLAMAFLKFLTPAPAAD